MKSKLFKQLLVLLFFIISCDSLYAQFKIIGNNKGWLHINSSNGGVIRNIIDIQLHMEGNTPYNYPRWSIVGRVTSPIINSENKIFPVEKMKFVYNSRRVVGIYETSNPTSQQIGVLEFPITMDFSPNYFIRNSPLNINAPVGTYGSIVLQYDVLIEGGNYLSALKSWQNYRINYEFSLLDENGQIIGSTTFPIDMQISPNGTYVDLPSLSIDLGVNSQNVELVFATANDYRNGVTKTYENALVINSNTGYEVTVKSLENKLRSSLGELDLDLINIQLKDPTTNTMYNKESVGNTPKRLATGVATSNSKKYSIIYSALPNSSLLNAKPGFYSVLLLYSVSPM